MYRLQMIEKKSRTVFFERLFTTEADAESFGEELEKHNSRFTIRIRKLGPIPWLRFGLSRVRLKPLRWLKLTHKSAES